MPTPLKIIGARQNWSTFVFGLFPVHGQILENSTFRSLFHNSTNWLSVPLGELTVKAWKWPINFTLLMNVIEGIYSTIAYILVTFEAYVFLYNHDTNAFVPFSAFFLNNNTSCSLFPCISALSCGGYQGNRRCRCPNNYFHTDFKLNMLEIVKL